MVSIALRCVGRSAIACREVGVVAGFGSSASTSCLVPDGRAKAGTERHKIMIGRSTGRSLVLAPCNDLLGLAITEGVGDALSFP